MPLGSIDDKEKPLTVMEKTFAENFVSCGFSVQKAGALCWGLDPKANEYRGWKMYNLPHVKKYIEELSEKRLKDMGFTKESVLEQYLKVSQADLGDFVEWASDPDGKVTINTKSSKDVDTSLVKKIKTDKFGQVEIELHDKMNALKNIADILGLIPKQNSMEIVGKGGGPIQVEIVRERLSERLTRFANATDVIIDVTDDSKGKVGE
jgi:hypothetical protein